MFTINSSATLAFLDALQCPTSFCNMPANATTVCGLSTYPFILCDNEAGPILSIENLTLSGTINGPLFASMGNVWVGLVLVNASLTGTIPSEILQLPSLRFLRLDNNLLSGTLPSEPSGVAMVDLRVTRNLLSGTIPKAYLFGMPSIVRLYLGDNRFSGSLPAVGVYPPQLDSLLVNDNALSGSLPTRLSLWSNSGKWFTVASNFLTGSLPSNIFSAGRGSFAYFRVDDNQLSGTVPSDLATQTSLRALNLSLNSFSGAVTLPSLTPPAHCFVGYNNFESCSQVAGLCCFGFDSTLSRSTVTSETTSTQQQMMSTELFSSTNSTPISLQTSSAPAAQASMETPGSAVTSPSATDTAALVGAIAGGVIAFLLLLLTGTIVVVVCRRRRRRQSRTCTVQLPEPAREGLVQSASQYHQVPAHASVSEYVIGNIDSVSSSRIGTDYVAFAVD